VPSMIFFLDIDGVMVHANPHRHIEQATNSFYVFNNAAVETFNTIFIAKEDQIKTKRISYYDKIRDTVKKL
jgi:Icc-related predicted phosphoesterase